MRNQKYIHLRSIFKKGEVGMSVCLCQSLSGYYQKLSGGSKLWCKRSDQISRHQTYLSSANIPLKLFIIEHCA